MKELIGEVIENYRQQEATHFEESYLAEFSKSDIEWYWECDLGDKKDLNKFLIVCELYGFTNHMYYKLLKLKYEL